MRGEDFSAVGWKSGSVAVADGKGTGVQESKANLPILDTLRGVVKDRRRGVQELAACAPTLSR